MMRTKESSKVVDRTENGPKFANAIIMMLSATIIAKTRIKKNLNGLEDDDADFKSNSVRSSDNARLCSRFWFILCSAYLLDVVRLSQRISNYQLHSRLMSRHHDKPYIVISEFIFGLNDDQAKRCP